MANKKTCTFTLSIKAKERLRKLAEKEDISMSSWLCMKINEEHGKSKSL